MSIQSVGRASDAMWREFNFGVCRSQIKQFGMLLVPHEVVEPCNRFMTRHIHQNHSFKCHPSGPRSLNLPSHLLLLNVRWRAHRFKFIHLLEAINFGNVDDRREPLPMDNHAFFSGHTIQVFLSVPSTMKRDATFAYSGVLSARFMSRLGRITLNGPRM